MTPAQDPPKPPTPSPGRKVTAEEMREQQAIAAAMMIAEQGRREDRQQRNRILLYAGLSIAGLAIFGLLVLFAYYQMRPKFNPFGSMVALAAVAAGGAVLAFWAYAENRRE